MTAPKDFPAWIVYLGDPTLEKNRGFFSTIDCAERYAATQAMLHPGVDVLIFAYQRNYRIEPTQAIHAKGPETKQ